MAAMRSVLLKHLRVKAGYPLRSPVTFSFSQLLSRHFSEEVKGSFWTNLPPLLRESHIYAKKQREKQSRGNYRENRWRRFGIQVKKRVCGLELNSTEDGAAEAAAAGVDGGDRIKQHILVHLSISILIIHVSSINQPENQMKPHHSKPSEDTRHSSASPVSPFKYMHSFFLPAINPCSAVSPSALLADLSVIAAHIDFIRQTGNFGPHRRAAREAFRYYAIIVAFIDDSVNFPLRLLALSCSGFPIFTLLFRSFVFFSPIVVAVEPGFGYCLTQIVLQGSFAFFFAPSLSHSNSYRF
ncbi:hypothetical protein MA16_Dca010456 [Dendrobium catenatum]|uniref:Uncharacterized protein n=1 Tax=Dendrobium catenatum TaxID=906689 RepID=A0A2I0XBJ1_9ASPA|nr:hypothetical protein MA16_Dca010456 [Dendrobium catenatum]